MCIDRLWCHSYPASHLYPLPGGEPGQPKGLQHQPRAPRPHPAGHGPGQWPAAAADRPRRHCRPRRRHIAGVNGGGVRGPCPGGGPAAGGGAAGAAPGGAARRRVLLPERCGRGGGECKRCVCGLAGACMGREAWAADWPALLQRVWGRVVAMWWSSAPCGHSETCSTRRNSSPAVWLLLSSS